MWWLRSNSTLFWAPENAGVRYPFLILFPFDWGSLRMQGLPSNSAVFSPPEKAGVRWPILILSPRLALGTPENAGVM